MASTGQAVAQRPQAMQISGSIQALPKRLREAGAPSGFGHGIRHVHFVRGGALLNDEQKARLHEINQESSLLGLKFRNNNLTETNESYIVIDNKADLAGLPEGIIAMGEEDARLKNMPGKWVFMGSEPCPLCFSSHSG